MKEENAKGQGERWVKVLLVAGVAIAAPRLMGAFAQLVGRDVLTMYGWFASFEVWTGGALALLEGLALAHIADRWKRFGVRSPYWWILAVIQLGLLLTLPFVSTVYLVAAQFGTWNSTDQVWIAARASEVLTWRHIFQNHLVWIWSYLGAAISTVIVMGVGIVHNVDNEGKEGEATLITTRKGREGVFSVDDLAKLLATKRPDLTPDDFVIALEAGFGASITTAEAEVYLSTARAQQAGNGRGRRVQVNGAH